MIRLFAVALLMAAPGFVSATEKPKDAPLPWLGMGYAWSATASGRAVLVVQRIAPDGPSARAGMKAGDTITTINDRAVDFGDELDLLLFLGDRKPGDRLHLDITREGKPRKIEVTLGTMPESRRAAWYRNLEIAKQQRARAAQQRK